MCVRLWSRVSRRVHSEMARHEQIMPGLQNASGNQVKIMTQCVLKFFFKNAEGGVVEST